MLPLLLLGFLWAVVLVPVGWKAHQERQQKFVSSLGDGLQALEQAGAEALTDERGEVSLGRGPDHAAPGEPAVSVVAHLRSIFAGLLIAVVVSLFVAVVTSQRAMLGVHLAIVNSLLAYVGFLVTRRDARAKPGRPASQTEPEAHAVAAAVHAAPTPPRPAYSAGIPVISAPVVSHAMSATPNPTG